jgi:cytochrome c5
MHNNTFKLVTLSALALLLAGCHKAPVQQGAPADEKSASAKPAAADAKDAEEGVALKP